MNRKEKVKAAFFVVFFLVANGIAGRMDYEDALAFEAAAKLPFLIAAGQP